MKVFRVTFGIDSFNIVAANAFEAMSAALDHCRTHLGKGRKFETSECTKVELVCEVVHIVPRGQAMTNGPYR